MRLSLPLSLAILLILTASTQAQPGMTAPGQTAPYSYQPNPAYVQQPHQLPTRTVSYGWHVFGADLASWAMLAADSDGTGGLATIGAAGLLLSGPIVHLAHGNRASAGYSLIARTGLPLAGGLLGSATCNKSADDGWDCIGNVFLGITLGYGSALALDWFHLAKKTEQVAIPTGWASVRPSLDVDRNGAKAGVAFKF